jgi:hypothetical protein
VKGGVLGGLSQVIVGPDKSDAAQLAKNSTVVSGPRDIGWNKTIKAFHK